MRNALKYHFSYFTTEQKLNVLIEQQELLTEASNNFLYAG